MRYEELTIEGRNAVLEAFRSGKTIDKLSMCWMAVRTARSNSILREARKHDTHREFCGKGTSGSDVRDRQASGCDRLMRQLMLTQRWRICLKLAEEKGEPPFLFLLDDIEDPHNLGAIIRTANLAGAHGVIIPKRRAVGLTATVARTSAGALNYTPVAKVTNLSARPSKN